MYETKRNIWSQLIPAQKIDSENPSQISSQTPKQAKVTKHEKAEPKSVSGLDPSTPRFSSSSRLPKRRCLRR